MRDVASISGKAHVAALLAAVALPSALLPSKAEANPVPARRSGPLLVSPSQLHASRLGAVETDYKWSSYREEQRWSATGSQLPGELRRHTTSQQGSIAYAWRQSPSLTTALHWQRFRDDTTIEQAGGRFEGQRTLTALGLDAAYKIMDKVVLGLGISERRSRSESSSAARASIRSDPSWQPAVLVKSEWYEIGLSQTVYRINQTQIDGTTSIAQSRESTLHATYVPLNGMSLGVILRQNPHPTCCLASSSKRPAYTFALSAWSPHITIQAALTYLPPQVEGESFGSAYHLARYRLETLAEASFKALTIGLTATYEHAADSSARVEIPALPAPITRASVRGAGWRLGVALSRAL